MLDGLCDLLCDCRVPEYDKQYIITHIMRDSDYSMLCQTVEGGFIHELHHNPSISFENCANAVAVLSSVSMLCRDENEVFSKRTLLAAERGFLFAETFKPTVTSAIIRKRLIIIVVLGMHHTKIITKVHTSHLIYFHL